MRKLLTYLLAFSVVLMFSGCWDVSNTDADSLEYRTVSPENMGIEFENPDEWYNPSWNVGDESKYVFIVPNQFSSEDKIEGQFAINIEPLLEGMNLDTALEVLQGIAEESGEENMKYISDNKDVTIAGQPGKEIMYSYDMDLGEGETRESITSYAAFIGKNNVYYIAFNDEKADYEKYRKVLDHLYETFKEL